MRRGILLLMLGIAGATPARADEPTPVTGAASASPRDELDTAIAAFLDGDSDRARALLRTLLTRGPELDAAVRRDALAYLGDILYTEEGPAAARSSFEALLDEAPDYRMDPIKHPPEVCSFFEDLRLSRRTIVTTPEPAPRREPFPVLSLAPLGVHWFARKQVGTGLLVGGLQAAAIATNIACASQILPTPVVEPGSPEEDEYYRLQVATDISAAIAWGAWFIPASVEIGRWAAAPRVTVLPTGNGLAVAGRF